MLTKVLFIAGQPGPLAYLEPIWKRLAETNAPIDWRVMFPPNASKVLRQDTLENIPFIGWAENEPQLDEALAGWQPARVMTSATFKWLETRLIEKMRVENGISFQFLDTPYDAAIRIRKTNPKGYFPDHILLVDSSSKDECLQDGFPPDCIKVVGHPAWEAVQLLPPKDQSHVVFVSQPISADLGIRLGYTEREAWRTILEARELREDLFSRLIFAPHPREAAPEGLADLGITVATSGNAALQNAGTVIGMFASTMVNAFLAGRQVISVQPGAVGPDMCVLSRDSYIPRTENAEDIIAALEGRQTSSANELQTAMAGSAERIIECLTKQD